MVDYCGFNPGHFVQSYQWLLEHLCSINMRQRSAILYRSRGIQHTYGHHHALFTSSDGLASPDESCPKDSLIYYFHDWRFVSLFPQLIMIPVHAQEDALLIASVISSSVIVASLIRIVLLHPASRIDPLC